jgi:hypothetical protein
MNLGELRELLRPFQDYLPVVIEGPQGMRIDNFEVRVETVLIPDTYGTKSEQTITFKIKVGTHLL